MASKPEISTFEVAQALPALFMAYQPIVAWPIQECFGYEALVRCHHPAFANPGILFATAEAQSNILPLSRAIRALVAQDISKLPTNAYAIFVNLHSQDLFDDELFDPKAPLSQWACHVVLEITERTVVDDAQEMQARIQKLRAMGYRIALDDVGAGFAGLATLTQLEPDIVKLDMSLVRDVHQKPTKSKVIGAMAGLCRELNVALVAEGIENMQERDALSALGCKLMQGYLFGRPEKTFMPPNFM